VHWEGHRASLTGDARPGIPVRFTVLDVDERKVNRVLVEHLGPRPAEEDEGQMVSGE
jgi:hypothetical protein